MGSIDVRTFSCEVGDPVVHVHGTVTSAHMEDGLLRYRVETSVGGLHFVFAMTQVDGRWYVSIVQLQDQERLRCVYPFKHAHDNVATLFEECINDLAATDWESEVSDGDE